MTDRELMQQALEVLNHVNVQDRVQIITALRERLALPEQKPLTEKRIEELYSFWVVDCQDIVGFARAIERSKPQMQPCAGRNCGSTNPNLHSAECFEDYEKATGLNQWHGLTDEAIWLEYQRFWPFHPADEPKLAQDIAKFARAIEAKLKENT